MSNAAVKPNVENILFLNKFGAAAFALCSGGQEIYKRQSSL